MNGTIALSYYPANNDRALSNFGVIFCYIKELDPLLLYGTQYHGDGWYVDCRLCESSAVQYLGTRSMSRNQLSVRANSLGWRNRGSWWFCPKCVNAGAK